MLRSLAGGLYIRLRESNNKKKKRQLMGKVSFKCHSSLAVKIGTIIVDFRNNINKIQLAEIVREKKVGKKWRNGTKQTLSKV